MAAWGRKCTSCHVSCIAAFWWEHRIEQAQTYICKCFFFYYYKYTKLDTQIYESDLIYKKVLERGGLGRHAVLVLGRLWRWSWWRLDRRRLVGRLRRTEINVRDSLLPGFLDAETEFHFLVLTAGCLRFLIHHHCQYCLTNKSWSLSVEKDYDLKNFSLKWQITLRVCGFSKNASVHHSCSPTGNLIQIGQLTNAPKTIEL